jgi:hypothetical protein
MASQINVEIVYYTFTKKILINYKGPLVKFEMNSISIECPRALFK